MIFIGIGAMYREMAEMGGMLLLRKPKGAS